MVRKIPLGVPFCSLELIRLFCLGGDPVPDLCNSEPTTTAIESEHVKIETTAGADDAAARSPTEADDDEIVRQAEKKAKAALEAEIERNKARERSLSMEQEKRNAEAEQQRLQQEAMVAAMIREAQAAAEKEAATATEPQQGSPAGDEEVNPFEAIPPPDEGLLTTPTGSTRAAQIDCTSWSKFNTVSDLTIFAGERRGGGGFRGIS